MIEAPIHPDGLAWEKADQYPGGTMVKTLRRGAGGDPLTILLKLPPGFSMADHSHVTAEHHYILEGEYEVRSERFSAGHYHFIPAHADHGPFLSENGAVVLVIWETTARD